MKKSMVKYTVLAIAVTISLAGCSAKNVNTTQHEQETDTSVSNNYGTSTDIQGAGDLVVYEKRGATYEKASLPFAESEEGYSQTLPIHYEAVGDRQIKVTVDNGAYETIVPIDQYQWDTLLYAQSYDDCTQNAVIWDSYFLEADGKAQLVCKVHLFDKWSDFGLFAVLRYENGKYVIDRWLPVNDDSQ